MNHDELRITSYELLATNGKEAAADQLVRCGGNDERVESKIVEPLFYFVNGDQYTCDGHPGKGVWPYALTLGRSAR